MNIWKFVASGFWRLVIASLWLLPIGLLSLAILPQFIDLRPAATQEREIHEDKSAVDVLKLCANTFERGLVTNGLPQEISLTGIAGKGCETLLAKTVFYNQRQSEVFYSRNGEQFINLRSDTGKWFSYDLRTRITTQQHRVPK